MKTIIDTIGACLVVIGLAVLSKKAKGEVAEKIVERLGCKAETDEITYDVICIDSTLSGGEDVKIH